MGSGSFNTNAYQQQAARYATKDRSHLFQQRLIFDDFDPVNIKVRESCVSQEHPDPTSIIIACDVTGSMGKIPENLLKGGLGKIMESLLSIETISNPQVMFAAIGDTECDKAPLQVTQFESDNRIESQLKNLYLEGGGGGNGIESYHSIWYFAAHKTRIDSLTKNGKKGILFTMGDEMVPNVLKAEHIRKFIDSSYRGQDIPTSELIAEVSKKFHVFHLIVQDTSTYKQSLGADKVDTCWQNYLDERAILVPLYSEIPDKIVSTVKLLCENIHVSKLPLTEPAADTNHHSNAEDVATISKIGLLKDKSKEPQSSFAALRKDNEGVPHMFICPISQEVMKDPVLALDGYNYERDEIMAWFKDHSTSPITGLLIKDTLTPNNDLRSEIMAWRDNQKHNQNSTDQNNNNNNNHHP